MKTDVLKVSGREEQIEAALSLAEKVAAYNDLSHKSAIHLRLLTEETMNMMRSITGKANGEFWIESDKGVYKIHLVVKTDTDEEQRKKLLSASSSGKNEATRGFMGKIRSFFEPVDAPVFFFDASPDGMFTDSTWSMRAYEEQLKVYVQEKRSGADEAWDELEKSVVSHVADDIKVSIFGNKVEMIIIKNLA